MLNEHTSTIWVHTCISSNPTKLLSSKYIMNYDYVQNKLTCSKHKCEAQNCCNWHFLLFTSLCIVKKHFGITITFSQEESQPKFSTEFFLLFFQYIKYQRSDLTWPKQLKHQYCKTRLNVIFSVLTVILELNWLST